VSVLRFLALAAACIEILTPDIAIYLTPVFSLLLSDLDSVPTSRFFSGTTTSLQNL